MPPAKKTLVAVTDSHVVPIKRPRLHKLSVSNFRAIGPIPVVIELDDVVVLVGPNNAGKSSILRAYQVAMENIALDIEDFPGGICDPCAPPTIELETVVFDDTAPGARWVRTDPTYGEMFVREKWIWLEPGAPKKVGWDVTANAWHNTEGPWGAANIAQAYRPKSHHISAFQDPVKQAEPVLNILKEAIKAHIKEAKDAAKHGTPDGSPTEYQKLFDQVATLQKSINKEAISAVESVRSSLETIVCDVLPGYSVSFDTTEVLDLDKILTGSPILKMGPLIGHHASIDRQGSGACRVLLWAALRLLAERPGSKSAAAGDRPNLLLMDEPEICLHPEAIREACRVLYDLPKNGNWQVMITTHSPIFIDLSRDNTSIVRVERNTDGDVHGTTIYRPQRANLSHDDKEELKLLNLCDPYVAEFFFGGRTIVVEGDTEYTAFRLLASIEKEKYKDVHIVRARGKACVKAICKILNQFNKNYAVVHDADRPTVIAKKTGKSQVNSMWTENSNILSTVSAGVENGNVRLIALVPNFEESLFGEECTSDKPYAAWTLIRNEKEAQEKVSSLLDALLDSGTPVPIGALAWKDITALKTAVEDFDMAQRLVQ